MSTINIEQRIDSTITELCRASGELRQCQRGLLDLRRMMPANERIWPASVLLTLCRINRRWQRDATAYLHALYGFGGGV